MSTALELPREELEKYAKALRERPPRVLTSGEAKAQKELLGLARKAAVVLKTQFGVKRVWLFGSLAHRLWFHSATDIDLAVEGLPPEDYLKAWGIVEDILNFRKFDLVDIEHASPEILHSIKRQGIEL